MLTRWNTGWSEVEDLFSTMNQLRTYIDRVFDESHSGRSAAGRAFPLYAGTWPRTNLIDSGSKLIVTAEVPGLTDKDINLTLNQDVLTIGGERKVEAPQGYAIHRQERAAVHFTRSFALPCRVNPDQTTASVKNGILTVTLEKAPDAMPRQITVTSTHS